MRNLWIFVILVFSLSYSAKAQFGVKGGLVWSDFGTDSESFTSEDARQGITLGVMYNYCLGCQFGLQTELNYVQKGERYDIPFYNVDAEVDYIDIPVALTWQPIGPIYIYGGPLFSFGLKEKLTFKGDVTGVETVFEDGDNFKNFDFGFNAGVGLKYQNVFLDARITRSFVDADEKIDNGDFNIDSYDLRNRTFQLTVGYLFD